MLDDRFVYLSTGIHLLTYQRGLPIEYDMIGPPCNYHFCRKMKNDQGPIPHVDLTPNKRISAIRCCTAHSTLDNYLSSRHFTVSPRSFRSCVVKKNPLPHQFQPN